MPSVHKHVDHTAVRGEDPSRTIYVVFIFLNLIVYNPAFIYTRITPSMNKKQFMHGKYCIENKITGNNQQIDSFDSIEYVMTYYRNFNCIISRPTAHVMPEQCSYRTLIYTFYN